MSNSTTHAPTRTRTRTRGTRSPRRWTCVGCEVTVRYDNGAEAPARPEGWTKRAGRWMCLHCRREQAVEAATKKGEDGWASRRQALVEFELRRSPKEPDGVIAKRANCSTGHVRKLRTQLHEAGKLTKVA